MALIVFMVLTAKLNSPEQIEKPLRHRAANLPVESAQ
jgi:hypothetical protein